MRHSVRIAATVLALVAAPAPARAAEAWTGAFSSGFGFFIGGGTGGTLARLRLDGDGQSRWASGVPLHLRMGIDVGRYGLAVLVDTQYTFLWAPSRDQGPAPSERHGHLEFLSVVPTVLFRPLSALYVAFGAGVAILAEGQNVLPNPASVRPELSTALGFIYRFPRSGEARGQLPGGLTVAFESRFHVPWDDRFLHFQLMAVLTVYLVLTGR
jgi:hypothetical protein